MVRASPTCPSFYSHWISCAENGKTAQLKQGSGTVTFQSNENGPESKYRGRGNRGIRRMARLIVRRLNRLPRLGRCRTDGCSKGCVRILSELDGSFRGEIRSFKYCYLFVQKICPTSVGGLSWDPNRRDYEENVVQRGQNWQHLIYNPRASETFRQFAAYGLGVTYGETAPFPFLCPLASELYINASAPISNGTHLNRTENTLTS
jgi:hypothetical protein